ncbi:hypothetical protein HDU80_000894 [Chytriomyces hyalinus]|nr:hypothetical protein HDU80_000894 [Chytriomyces hyalinus]
MKLKGRPHRVYEQVVDACNKYDQEAVLALYDENIIIEVSTEFRLEGMEQLRRQVQSDAGLRVVRTLVEPVITTGQFSFKCARLERVDVNSERDARGVPVGRSMSVEGSVTAEGRIQWQRFTFI